MSLFCCDCRCRCPLVAIIVSIILGVVTAFLQIAGAITVTPAFLWVLLGIAIVYLGVLLIAAALTGGEETNNCLCIILFPKLYGNSNFSYTS